MDYDVIIAGASFAGLAVAAELRGQILLVDRTPIGSGQTSACGTPLDVPQRLDAPDSVLQVYPVGAIHTPGYTAVYPLPHPFCALDYERFCQALARHTDAEVLQANVVGLDRGAVVTSRGTFSARCLVDASGWRAVLGSALHPGLVDRCALTFGQETTPRYRQSDGIYFWWDPALVRQGIAWLFPAGPRSRLGIASYRGESALGPGLRRFLAGYGLRREGGHGGFIPSRLRTPTVGPVFLVGDAAGQCLPFTAEGIRPALYFGQHCGRLIQRVMDHDLSLDEALRAYRQLVARFRPVYAALAAIQWMFTNGNEWAIRQAISFIERPAVRNWCLDRYHRLFELQPLPSVRHHEQPTSRAAAAA